MGFFRWLFGVGSLPSWARPFERSEDFERWVDEVLRAVTGAGFHVTREQARSGSFRLRDPAGREREVILQDLAERCARIPPPEWPERITGQLGLDHPELFGQGATVASEALGLDGGPPLSVGPKGGLLVGDYDAGGTGNLLLVGTGWGGVYLIGQGRYVTVCVFPVGDAALLDALGDRQGPNELARLAPAPALKVLAVVLFNHTEDGVLHGSRIARQLGAPRVLATDPSRPIDRGVDEPKPVPAGPVARCDDWPGIAWQRLDTVAPAFRALLSPGLEDGPVVLGLGLPYDVLSWRPHPRWIVGSLLPGSAIPADIGEALLDPPSAVLVEDGSGAATAQAEQLEQLDIPVTLLGGAVAPADDEEPP